MGQAFDNATLHLQDKLKILPSNPSIVNNQWKESSNKITYAKFS